MVRYELQEPWILWMQKEKLSVPRRIFLYADAAIRKINLFVMDPTEPRIFKRQRCNSPAGKKSLIALESPRDALSHLGCEPRRA